MIRGGSATEEQKDLLTQELPCDYKVLPGEGLVGVAVGIIVDALSFEVIVVDSILCTDETLIASVGVI